MKLTYEVVTSYTNGCRTHAMVRPVSEIWRFASRGDLRFLLHRPDWIKTIIFMPPTFQEPDVTRHQRGLNCCSLKLF